MQPDALFRRVCGSFDEGGLSGLLLNQCQSSGDGGHLLLHTISTPGRDELCADALPTAANADLFSGASN